MKSLIAGKAEDGSLPDNVKGLHINVFKCHFYTSYGKWTFNIARSITNIQGPNHNYKSILCILVT